MIDRTEFHWLSILAAIIYLMITAFIVYFIILYRRKQQENHRNMEQMRLTFEGEMLRTQLEISEQTMRNLSQEIHDNIGQSLSLAKMQLHAVATETSDERLEAGKQLISRAIQDLRGLSRSLNGNYVLERGLYEAVQNELDMIEATGQVQCMYDWDDAIPNLNDQQCIVLFRCTQEALNNALRHGEPTSIKVDIACDGEQLCLSITDNGKGIDTNAAKGIGLSSMEQRIRMLNGTFHLSSKPGQGTRILLRVPCSA